MLRRTWIGAGIAALAMGAVNACGGSDGGGDVGSSGAPADEAGAGDGSPTEDAPGTLDAGTDGEAVTEGGSNIDPDAAAEDAGACAANLTLVNDAPARQSDCISAVPAFPGGAIVTGKYHLMEIHALAPRTFCEKQFVTVGFRETVQIDAADASGTFASETVLQLADGVLRRSAAVFTPGPGNTSPMQLDPTCPDKPAASVRYASFVRQSGRQALALLLPYGQGFAVYVLEKVP